MNKNSKRIVMLCLCSLLVLQSLFCTGCCRIMGEGEALQHKNKSFSCMYPPDRIFFGTRLYLGFFLFFPPAFLDLPLELAADVVLLPFDIAYFAYYLAKPPLSLLVEKHRNDRLETMLKLGVDPNKIDYRYYMPDWLPLFVAFQNDNSEAARLLLEHGAKLKAKDVFILKGGGYSDEKNKVALYALRSEIPKEMVQDKEARFLVNSWVRLWIKRRLDHKSDEHDGTIEFEVVSLLLKHGFPVNSIRETSEQRTTQKTALDEVLMERQLAPEDKDRMVALLRSHDAKTFAELAKEDASLPHLDLLGIEIMPQFRPVVDILEHSKEVEGYRVADRFDGIEGPLLVFEFVPLKRAKEGHHHTKKINVHRRKPLSMLEWNQETELVEVPEFFRIILTPKGRKVPSQIHSDWPREMVLREQWVTLETCEMYVAFNAERCPGQLLAYEDLEAIALTTVPRDMSKYAARSCFPHLKSPDEYRFFDYLSTGKLDDSVAKFPEVQDAVKRANRRTSELGLPGEWRVHSIIHHDGSDTKWKDVIAYFYSSRRTIEELLDAQKPLAPFRDEIVLFAYENVPREPGSGTLSFYIDDFKNYGGYWKRVDYYFDRGDKRKTAKLLCGDDVSQKTREAIVDVLVELFK